jgi:tetratricopeptide (TPR) repeat protein
VSIDREETLKKAEKLLRQGRLDAAIAEYVRVVDDNPRDWTTTNTLGDLLVRAGQLEKAAAQYLRIAEHFVHDGFYPKAAALFKKILKFRPDDEAVQLQLADISARQGLFADAKAYLTAVAARRRARGDRHGADEILIRLGSLDPSDFEARGQAARVLGESGDTAGAAQRYRALADDLFEKSREAEALAALKQAVLLDPSDVAGRTQLARAYVGSGDTASAREFLDPEAVGDDPALLMALAEIELRDGDAEAARPSITRALDLDATLVDGVVQLGWALCQSNPSAAFVCIDAASDTSLAQGDFQTAASILQEYVARATSQVPALLKLVEVCVDGGLETAMYDTQAQLCDAYLASGQATEARVIAEDLVAREPWEATHIERFRHALIMLKVSDPDSVIAERLNGQVPFTATDRFADDQTYDPYPSADPAEAEIPEVADWSAPPPGPIPAAEQDDESDSGALQGLLRDAEQSDHGRLEAVEVDLTSALWSLETAAEDTAPAPSSLDDVFSRARQQAARAPGAEAAAEHLRLGQTYLEAGLVDEAIPELAQAARSPRHRFEAASALGRLYRDRQELGPAIEWLERAVESPAPTADDGRALLYELGVVLEELGEHARALAVFLELLADVGPYRDIEARAARLSKVETGS